MKYRSSLFGAVFIVVMFYWLLGVVVFLALPPALLESWRANTQFALGPIITPLTALPFQLNVLASWTFEQLQIFGLVLIISFTSSSIVLVTTRFGRNSRNKVGSVKRGISNINGDLPLPDPAKRETLYVEILEWVGDRALGAFAIDVINLVFCEKLKTPNKKALVIIQERLEGIENEWRDLGGRPLQLILLILEQYIDSEEGRELSFLEILASVRSLNSWWEISLHDLDVISAYLKKEIDYRDDRCLYPYLNEDDEELLRGLEYSDESGDKIENWREPADELFETCVD